MSAGNLREGGSTLTTPISDANNIIGDSPADYLMRDGSQIIIPEAGGGRKTENERAMMVNVEEERKSTINEYQKGQ